MPIVNTSGEPVTILAGTAMATASPWEESEGAERRVRHVGTEKRWQVITPIIERIREWNSKVPELSRQKRQHLSAEEREVIEPVTLEYEELPSDRRMARYRAPPAGATKLRRGTPHQLRNRLTGAHIC
jgi:hypothetical protein